jgi:hypothetical protein
LGFIYAIGSENQHGTFKKDYSLEKCENRSTMLSIALYLTGERLIKKYRLNTSGSAKLSFDNQEQIMPWESLKKLGSHSGETKAFFSSSSFSVKLRARPDFVVKRLPYCKYKKYKDTIAL